MSVRGKPISYSSCQGDTWVSGWRCGLPWLPSGLSLTPLLHSTWVPAARKKPLVSLVITLQRSSQTIVQLQRIQSSPCCEEQLKRTLIFSPCFLLTPFAFPFSVTRLLFSFGLLWFFLFSLLFFIVLFSVLFLFLLFFILCSSSSLYPFLLLSHPSCLFSLFSLETNRRKKVTANLKLNDKNTHKNTNLCLRKWQNDQKSWAMGGSVSCVSGCVGGVMRPPFFLMSYFGQTDAVTDWWTLSFLRYFLTKRTDRQ